MHRNAHIFAGSIALCWLVSIAAPVSAAQATPVRKSTAAKQETKPAPAKPAAAKPQPAAKKPTPLYSPTRSLNRQAATNRARAIAADADTAVPRYKVDAAGDLVPDLRAAALSDAMSSRCSRSSVVTLSFSRRNVVDAWNTSLRSMVTS